MGKPSEEPKPRWTEEDHYRLMSQILESKRSQVTTIATRVGGLVLAAGGGYVANRFGLHGLELGEAAAPGIFLDLYVGLSLKVERVAADKQTKRSLDLAPSHPWRSRIAAFGSASIANAMAFGSGAALAYASQELHNSVAAGAGTIAALIGLGAVGVTESLGVEFSVKDAGESLDPPMRMHRRIFNDGSGLYRRTSGPSPDS